MIDYIKLVQNQTELTAFKASNDFITPNVTWVYDTRTVDYNPHYYSQDYLTFVAEEDGTFNFSRNNINYSVDGGKTWTTLTSNTNTPTIQAGSKIMWKAVFTPELSNGIGTFHSTGRFIAQGNPMSLLYGDDFKGQTSLSGKDYAFACLFIRCTGLTSAKNIALVATTLSEDCYSHMFEGCTSLTMIPTLPATTLAPACYMSMFNGCSSLTKAPTLPAITLTQACYMYMFQNCISLTTAPVLPATTLTTSCYLYMFNGCTKLNNITCLATNTSASLCTYYWVNGVASTGTFTKAANVNNWPMGVSGIPSGWTIQNS